MSWIAGTPLNASWWPFNWSNQISSLGQTPTSDSDLPDEVIMDECRNGSMKEAYEQRDWEGPLVAQSRKRPHIASVRGTTDGIGWASNILRGAAYKNDKWALEVQEIRDFLAAHPEVTDVIGHSRGGPQAIEAAYHNPHVKVVMVDGASILAQGITAWTRNLNTNSSADSALQTIYGKDEFIHPWANVNDTSLSASARAGHQVWAKGIEYKKQFRGKPQEKRMKATGYYDGRIKYVDPGVL